MSTFTLEQKKLEQLRKQLYGKQELPTTKKASSKRSNDNQMAHTSSFSSHTPASINDTHIKKDLTKVAFITGIALIFQYLLYTAITNNWLRVDLYGFTF